MVLSPIYCHYEISAKGYRIDWMMRSPGSALDSEVGEAAAFATEWSAGASAAACDGSSAGG